MAKFVEIPGVDFHGATEWKLRERLVYESDRWVAPIIVPAGFVTDLASIPRIFQGLIPKIGKHRLPAIVHDYLVRRQSFERRLADRIFLEAMKLQGVNVVRRRLMYWAVALQTRIKRLRR